MLARLKTSFLLIAIAILLAISSLLFLQENKADFNQAHIAQGVKIFEHANSTQNQRPFFYHETKGNQAQITSLNSQKVASNNATISENMVTVTNMDELNDYFRSPISDSIFDFESLLDFTNSSPQAFAYIADLYVNTGNAWQQKRAFELLFRCLHPEKVSFIASLLRSTDLDLQSKGARLLSTDVQTTEQYELMVSLIIEASYSAENPEALTHLIKALQLTERKSLSNDFTDKLIVDRLHELASDSHPSVANIALSTLLQVSQGETALAIVNIHLSQGSESTQLNALQSIRDIAYPGEEVMLTLNQIMNDNSLPREVRALAAKRLVDFENYASMQDALESI
ncbi:hypothetical protein ISG33_02075 [Glaciecola sp. MH2013]|uniref:hypothetical protein n=1 Tax=Glaciecola sp. MH2013 TaxID=2785524 RepID=UPI00189CC57F|nr:hypothetical protein [Glaciecola sp. MH2013]MBF7072189.1 hypothetical protein [Glaciecola sp. MH2013]